MNLRDRLRNASGADDSAPSAPVFAARPAEEPAAVDPFAAIKRRAQDALFARLGSRLYDASMGEDQLDQYVVQELSRIIDGEQLPLTPAERARIVAEVCDDVLGYGAIERFLADPDVTEVMVNSLDAIYVERRGRIERTESRYLSEDHLRQVIERIVSRVGRRIDESSPMVDARLADGSRVNAVYPTLARKGAALTVRRFPSKRVTMDELVKKFKSLTPGVRNFLEAAVLNRRNVMVSGGTGSGKTTLLNCLSGFIPSNERIVTIEGVAPVGAPSDVQQAFVDAGAVQCGFCTPGLIMATHSLLERSADPTELEIREELSGNICRCTGYGRIIEAVQRVAVARRSAS